jgi:DNA (cytosine-5)-methyltransferase 1
MEEVMKYISLFAGIGGFDLALNRLGHECVWANEWDKYAGQIYNSRFNTKIDSRDIRLVKTDELPDFDLLVGGFPCQAFSIAGKRLGFEDTRGTLFFEIARIIKDKRPKYFLLENVKGLLSHESGKTFQTILASINELGYECEWQILNSKNHRVPQNRERIFISGYIRGEPRPEIFSFRYTNSKDIVQINNPTHSNKRVYDTEGISPTLNTMQGGNRQPKIAIPTINPDRENIRQSRRFKENGDVSYTLVCQFVNGVMIYEPVVHNLQTRNPNRPSLTRLCDCNSGKLYQKCCGTPAGSGHISKSDGTTYCLDTGNSQGIEYKGKIRRLTEIECERLQGFPDNWTEGVSSTQRYKALGNAVTVNVIYDICKGYPNE